MPFPSPLLLVRTGLIHFRLHAFEISPDCSLSIDSPSPPRGMHFCYDILLDPYKAQASWKAAPLAHNSAVVRPMFWRNTGEVGRDVPLRDELRELLTSAGIESDGFPALSLLRLSESTLVFGRAPVDIWFGTPSRFWMFPVLFLKIPSLWWFF